MIYHIIYARALIGIKGSTIFLVLSNYGLLKMMQYWSSAANAFNIFTLKVFPSHMVKQ